ncbi:MAG TPA: FHA domain-containing serine/threonine-protein kinase [Urbifossiella sp.]|jgi:hypothetical protein|nr:FHA domain-containing serine/threonine-protein kinase [Urbifossiella sp.]
MRAPAILKCLARAALKGVGNCAGLALGDAVIDLLDGAWAEWTKEKAEADRRAELDAIVRMAADEFRRHVEAVVREVAPGQPPRVQEQLSSFLQRLPELARQRFSRQEDRAGTSIPPGLRCDQASDFTSIFTGSPPVPTEDDDVDGPRVTLRYTCGVLTGQERTYTAPILLRYGRDPDCDPQLPQEAHARVSRHHCFLEIHPPEACILDLGSMHGTFVNGQLLGKRPKGVPPAPGYESPEHLLVDGTEVRLSDRGQLAFTVHVHCPPQPPERECAWCQAEVREPGANRPGAFVCAACRANRRSMVEGPGNMPGAKDDRPHAVRDYDILGELGRGGMGAVYLGRHRTTGEPAAIKLMLPQVAASDRAVRMFQREIRNVMALSHPNVVRCLDEGYSQGAFFLILDFCEGGSVDKLMKRRGGKLSVDEAVDISLQALGGLDYSHRAEIPFVKQKGGGHRTGVGLVHRDLKPANLFLSGQGSSLVVKIGDYGLAKGFDEAGLSGRTRTGGRAGTPEFMCRRQIDPRAPAGPEVDVWAMAASLYFMLTGNFPRDFPDDRPRWTVLMEDAPIPILKRNPQLPPKLAAVIDSALREDEMPFTSAAALRDAIESA